MADLVAYADELLKAKGLGSLDPGVFEQMKADLAERMEGKINAMILDRLPVSQLPIFDSLLDTADEDQIRPFLLAHIPDLDAQIKQVLWDFHRTYLGG